MSQSIKTNSRNRPQSAQSAASGKEFLIAKPADKEKSHPFFQNSKVQCCSYVKIINGVPQAIPMYQKPSKTYAEQMNKLGVKESLSQEQFKFQSPISASTKKKPLCRYDPNAPRNVLAQPAYRMPRSNVSSIVFGDEKVQFKTSSQYGNHANVGFVTNPQTLAHLTKELKGKIQK